MKRILLVVCSIFVLVSNSYCEEQKEFVNSSFSANYPFDWEVNEISGAVVFKSPLESKQDDFQENVAVLV